jgi:hypothetical protein
MPIRCARRDRGDTVLDVKIVGSRGLAKLAVPATSVILAAIALAGSAGAEPPSYGSNGVFSVGADATPGWTTASIPPGRYRVDQAPSMSPYQSAPGYWLRCNAFPCTPNHPGHIIATGPALRDESTLMEIAPGDVAVSLHNATLTIAN